MKCNAKLRPNYFYVNVSVLAVAFCRQISKTRQFYLKLYLICKSNNDFYHDCTSVFRCFFSEKDPHLNAVEY